MFAINANLVFSSQKCLPLLAKLVNNFCSNLICFCSNLMGPSYAFWCTLQRLVPLQQLTSIWCIQLLKHKKTQKIIHLLLNMNIFNKSYKSHSRVMSSSKTLDCVYRALIVSVICQFNIRERKWVISAAI